MRDGRRDVFASEDAVVRVECIGEAHLKALVGRHAEDGECDYCGRRGKVTSIGELAGYVETAFEHHFRRTESEPSGFEYAMSKEFGWERDGDPVAPMIGGAARVADRVAEDIRLILEARHTDIERDQRCEEGPFDKEAHYVEKEADDVEYQASWRAFEESLKTESRYFSAVGGTVLEDVFRGLGEHRSPNGRPVIVDAGPETDVTGLYRARVFQSTSGLDEALKRPTHIRMIHRRLSAARRLNLDPMPVGAPPARFGTKHPVKLVAEPFGAACALRGVGTARGQRGRVAHRRPPLARLSPTSFTGSATTNIL